MRNKGIYLKEAGTVVIIILVVAVLSFIHNATGGDNKGEAKRITVRPEESK